MNWKYELILAVTCSIIIAGFLAIVKQLAEIISLLK